MTAHKRPGNGGLSHNADEIIIIIIMETLFVFEYSCKSLYL